VSALARRLDATEGQVWSLGVGLVVAVVLAVVGIPPVVHHRTVRERPAVASFVAPSTATEPVAAAAPSPPIEAAAPPTPVMPITSFASAPVVSPAPPEAQEVPTLPLRTEVQDAGVAVAAGADGTAFVADGERIAVVDRSGRRVRDLPGGAAGLAVDGARVVATLDDRVDEIDLASGRRSVLASIPDLAPCVLPGGDRACEPGVEDGAPRPGALVVLGDALFVADAGQGTVWRVRAGKAERWASSSEWRAGGGPSALAVLGDGTVLVAVPTDVTLTNPGGATLQRVGADGSTSTYATFEPGVDPTAIAVLDDGTVVVSLRGAEALAVLSSGSARRIAMAALGVATSGPGQLLVTTPGHVVRMAPT
jgi:hypothetical protein